MKSNMANRALIAVAMGVAIIWTLVPTPVTWAEMPGYGQDMGPNVADIIWHLLRTKETLGLTDEQQTRLLTVAVSFKKADVQKVAEIDLAEIDLHQFMAKILFVRAVMGLAVAIGAERDHPFRQVRAGIGQTADMMTFQVRFTGNRFKRRGAAAGLAAFPGSF